MSFNQLIIYTWLTGIVPATPKETVSMPSSELLINMNTLTYVQFKFEF